jgi:hypothetical protein
VNQNVAYRADSSQFGRQVVVNSRIAMALAGWGVAALSVVVQWWRRRTPVALLCLLIAPFPMLPLQPYGGEMALRVCYFSLPAVAILIAQLLVPAGRLHVRRAVVVGVVLALLVPGFITARYGNESFESFTDDDVALSRSMYSSVPDGSLVFVVSRQTLLYWQRVDEVHFRTLPSGTAVEITAALSSRYLPKSPVYVMLTESQAAYGVVSGGRVPGWLDQFRSELEQTGRYRTAISVGDAVLLEMTPG